jgi:hypothetical protein
VTTIQREELYQVLSELHSLFPHWRFGQLVANLATAAGETDPAAIWELEDDQLLAAARRLIDQNNVRDVVRS